ncbi:histidine kinase N-terminal 7TM domain-containing protein [Halovivax gelatinilyticus]|uniref:histidine kinase N-terminal 7TM domain-containing protein n=1 Tax=Halovivax gelatinilyticus TaxID=2961597 RepID=UPI0020CA91AF|nr:histidine kinase N-terminal 7TM domain-containing protein [Halovivax gelatinilyticus]
MLGTLGVEFEYTIYTPILLGAAGVMATIGGYAWRNREVTGASTFAVLMAATTIWAVGYALQLAGANEATIRFFANVNHVGVAIVPVAWFCFTLQFGVRENVLTRRAIGALSAIPVGYLALVVTNEYHHLVRSPIELMTVGDVLVSDHGFGIAFWIHAAYGYGLMLGGIVVLAHLLVWSPRVYRRQVSLLLLGAAVAVATNVVYHAGYSPFSHLDLTPFSFTLTGIIFFVAIYHYRLFDLAPVARSFVVDTLDDGIVVLDRSNRVVDCTDTAAAMLDTEAAPAIGRPFETLLPTDARVVDRRDRDPLRSDGRPDASSGSAEHEGASSLVDDTTASRYRDPDDESIGFDDEQTDEETLDGAGSDGDILDHASTSEIHLETRDGTRYIECSTTPVLDLGGTSLGRTVVLRDVTETRELEAAVDDTLARLRRSNEELESFAAVISHDLRGPLRTTERYLSLLGREESTPRAGTTARNRDGERSSESVEPAVSSDENATSTEQELLDVARENTRRAQEMVDDLLSYSRIGAAGETFEPVDCDRVVRAVRDGLRYEIDDRDATVEIERLPTVYGVEHLLFRLFQNLIANALAYAGDEAPHIVVSGSMTDEYAELSVSDDGVGIDPIYQERLFQLFERGPQTGSDDGTGMGLAICQKIVDVHDGEIWLESTPGEGTTVTVRIPVESDRRCAGEGRGERDEPRNDRPAPVGTRTGNRRN